MRRSIIRLAILITLLSVIFYNSSPGQDSFDVNIQVDVSSGLGPVNHIWRYFGADEPNYAYMKNGNKLLGDLGSLSPGEVFFRAHNLLNSGDGSADLKWGSTNAYTEDEEGNPIYYWDILDSIFDTYLKNGITPYVEIGFMPEALSVNPEPYRHYWNPSLPYGKVYTGWAYPPDDYKKWGDLVYNWVLHCIERYGRKEVKQWYWETWNEPNIAYWQGTREEFFKLHDYAIAAVLMALPEARVGGPDVAGHGGSFMRYFIEHCLNGVNYATGETGTKMDFVAFHAKGSPVYVNGHVRMNMGRQLLTIKRGFEIISSYPELDGIPIIIGESDPEGCAACQGESLGYRNGTMYSSYTAASFIRKMDLALLHDVNLEGALSWAFEFEDQPYFAGFRSLATNGINKPVYNVFRMFSMMEGERVDVKSDYEVPLEKILEESVRENPDVSAFASKSGNRIYIMAWHYHDDDTTGTPARINMDLTGLDFKDGKCTVDRYLIDEYHSNSYTAWKEMSSPQNPDEQQVRTLMEKSSLQNTAYEGSTAINNGIFTIEDVLDRQAVALYVINFIE
ncbi:MAG: beta-xylosidase [Bacteroidota bacterium]|nr:beta-xylosidase [Bacteroidota bacterium]